MKTIQKSIRMTEEIHNYVEKFSGKGFNEKFENLVLFFMTEEKETLKRLAEQKNTYKANEKRIQLQNKVLADLESISRSVKSLLDVTKAAEVSAKEEADLPHKGKLDIAEAAEVSAKEESGLPHKGKDVIQIVPITPPPEEKNAGYEFRLWCKDCVDCMFCVKKEDEYYCSVSKKELLMRNEKKCYLFDLDCGLFKPRKVAV